MLGEGRSYSHLGLKQNLSRGIMLTTKKRHMKLSHILHIAGIIVGFAGIITALAGIVAGAESLVWGLTREHLFLCSGLLMLIAIWISVSTIHHVMLEKERRLI